VAVRVAHLNSPPTTRGSFARQPAASDAGTPGVAAAPCRLVSRVTTCCVCTPTILPGSRSLRCVLARDRLSIDLDLRPPPRASSSLVTGFAAYGPTNESLTPSPRRPPTPHAGRGLTHERVFHRLRHHPSRRGEDLPVPQLVSAATVTAGARRRGAARDAIQNPKSGQPFADENKPPVANPREAVTAPREARTA
jgi:hypothetical protein